MITKSGQDPVLWRDPTTTRDLNGIDADVKINKALWMLGERMAQIKNA